MMKSGVHWFALQLRRNCRPRFHQLVELAEDPMRSIFCFDNERNRYLFERDSFSNTPAFAFHCELELMKLRLAGIVLTLITVGYSLL